MQLFSENYGTRSMQNTVSTENREKSTENKG